MSKGKKFMRKKIAFIATGYIVKYDGISVYTENLLDAFLELTLKEGKKYDIDIYIGQSVEELIVKRVLSRYENEELSYRLVVVNDKSFFHKMFYLYSGLLANGRYDTIFATNFMPLSLLPSRIVKVIHDLSPETNPHLYSKFHRIYHAFLLRSGKWFDSAMGYISDTTKKDLQKFYAINDTNTRLLYLPNGVPFKVKHFQRPDESLFYEKFASRKLNLLVVGRLNRAKGIDRILKFCNYFDDYIGKNKKFDEVVLHFTGKQTQETTDLFRDADFKNIEIVFDGFLDDETLNKLYREANFCIFLSRNEGYGLPLVEAMWFRAVPVLSDIPIFREIMKEGYPLFGEREGFEKDITNFMVQLFEDKHYLEKIHTYVEDILSYEREGYARAAKNLIDYIDTKK
jgi:glycosyltransferase involved in cell wall biosynthesis